MAAETLITGSTGSCDLHMCICHITRDAHVELRRHNTKGKLAFSLLFCLVVRLGYENTLLNTKHIQWKLYYGLKFIQDYYERSFLPFK